MGNEFSNRYGIAHEELEELDAGTLANIDEALNTINAEIAVAQLKAAAEEIAAFELDDVANNTETMSRIDLLKIIAKKKAELDAANDKADKDKEKLTQEHNALQKLYQERFVIPLIQKYEEEEKSEIEEYQKLCNEYLDHLINSIRPILKSKVKDKVNYVKKINLTLQNNENKNLEDQMLSDLKTESFVKSALSKIKIVKGLLNILNDKTKQPSSVITDFKSELAAKKDDLIRHRDGLAARLIRAVLGKKLSAKLFFIFRPASTGAKFIENVDPNILNPKQY